MKKTRPLAMLLCIVMICSLVSGLSFGSAAEGDITLIAASDFQPKNGGAVGIENVKKILSAMGNAGIKTADGFLFCGDYDFGTFGNAEETKEGIGLLKDAMNGIVDEKNMVFVQGNHDAVVGTCGLSLGGNNDPKDGKYGVFVINNDDYMWYNKDELRIKRTAQRLIDYLNDKLEKGYDKPIFVLSHLPLHYNLRTVRDGDGKYASYIFDALNEAGKKGLNIFFLFGHDHSNGWDDYLGGSAIYLANSQTEFEEKQLNFTYMNAGYTGYYDAHNVGTENTLTMTAFKITASGAVMISRYSEEGLHNLKSAGVRNEYKDENAYDPDTRVIDKPQIVAPTKVTDATPIESIMNLTVRGRQYSRVNSAEDLKDGGKYILVYNSDVDQIMKPESVEKSNASGARVGLELVNVYGFGEQEVYGRYQDLEWTFTKRGDKWLLGRDGKFIRFTPTTDKAVTVTFESVGTPLSLEGEAIYTFSSGEYVFNYNARGLMNAYTADPAQIYVYEYVGYTVAVTGGSATAGGEKVKVCDVGTSVTVTADAPAEGMRFDKWVLEYGKLEGVDLSTEVLTFSMPESALELKASYAPIEAEQDKNPTDSLPNDEKPSEDKNGTDGSMTIVIVVIAAVAVAAAAAVAVIAIKKKKK